ncbi:MAG: epimerase [Amycolatopsis sp.]|uniref:NAD-dependent epimerase/dehydratase family protein n=1 Tax=Amycolatopsis sp. TaxID=37632 RepID=UPI00260375D2|nr:NAD-dependent epimerase/dehydratase family protein [Amycolatopsis sp.]MCU1684387.1 epimerase [Amycolatopsis sp.]
MKVFLTGGTGYLGSAVLAELVRQGHDVVAHARTEDSAKALDDAGASPALGDLTDIEWMITQVEPVDGVISTASPGNRTNAEFESGLLDAVLPALARTDKPYVHTGGTWIHGSGRGITEQTPADPPPIVAWRPRVVERIRAAAKHGIRTSVVAPANVYGRAGGIPAKVVAGPIADGALLYPGVHQHFGNVFVDDIAALYVLALTTAPAGSYLLGANEHSPAMDQIATAASRIRGLDGRIRPEPVEASRNRLGPIADAVFLDQQFDTTHARALGWRPNGPSLLDEFTTGSYTL